MSVAPSAKVVRTEAKIAHRYVATLPAEMFHTTAPVSLQKPSMEGIESSSHDPLNMMATKIVRKTTTSLREIVMADKRTVMSRISDMGQAQEDANGLPVPSFFPLEFFDDKTFEKQSSEEWMQSNGGEPVEAKSLWHFGDGMSEWKDVLVLQVNASGEQYFIQWKHNNKQKWAGRLNLCFIGESLDRHQKRREQALNNRTRVEAFMRYERTIDLMLTEKQLQLTPSQFHNIVRRVGMHVSGEQLRRNQELVEDVLYHYCRTINKMDYDALNPEADASQRLDPIEMNGQKELPVTVKKIPGRGTVSTVPLILVAALDQSVGGEPTFEAEGEQAQFRLVVAQVERSLPWAPAHLLTTLFAFQGQITRLAKISFLWDCSEAVQLSVFKEKHVACWTRSIEDITSSMMESMSDSMLLAYTSEESALGHSMSSEHRIKYTRTVELANKMLRDALRDAITNDMLLYVRRMETYLRPQKPAPRKDTLFEGMEIDTADTDTSAVDPDAAALLVAAPIDDPPGNWFGEEEKLPDDLTLGVRAEHPPMFLVDLKYDPNGQCLLSHLFAVSFALSVGLPPNRFLELRLFSRAFPAV